MSHEEIRIRALELAVKHCGEHSDVVSEAERYAEFLLGKQSPNAAKDDIRAIAIEVVIAASKVQAAHAANEAIDRYRVSASELEGFLCGRAPDA